LDYPFRTEQKNVGNAVVMRPRRGPQDDFVDAGAAHGIGKYLQNLTRLYHPWKSF
jgi:hypothetical protein